MRGDVPNPPLDFEGRGTRRSLVEGLFGTSSKKPHHRPSGGPPPLQKQGRIR
jgi:hypothetical protein